MLGSPKPRRLDHPIAVSLEDLVPQDHYYRHLEAKLDLGFVRDWTRELYSQCGRPSIDPVIFFKLQLVMFFEDSRSERQLITMASLNLAHRWYLGYALDEDLPDHSSLTRIRRRLGIDVFQRFFEEIIDLCQEAGLVWGRELYVDATKVVANADLDSLVPRFYYEATTHVAELFAGDAPGVVVEAEPKSVADDLPDGVMRLPRGEPPEESSVIDRPWQLLEERRLDPHPAAARGYERTSARCSRHGSRCHADAHRCTHHPWLPRPLRCRRREASQDCLTHVPVARVEDETGDAMPKIDRPTIEATKTAFPQTLSGANTSASTITVYEIDLAR